MFRSLKFIVITAFFTNSFYSFFNIIVFLSMLLSPCFHLLIDISYVEDSITLTSQILGLSVSLVSSTFGVLAKNNSLRVMQGYGLNTVNAFISIFFVIFLSILPSEILILLNDETSLFLYVIIFLIAAYLAVIFSCSFCSKRGKSLKTVTFLQIGIMVPFTIMISMYGNEVTSKYSVIFWIDFLGEYSWMIFLLVMFILIIILFSKINLIGKINWNKWSK